MTTYLAPVFEYGKALSNIDGNRRHLAKPVEPEVLVSAIADLVQQHKAQ